MQVPGDWNSQIAELAHYDGPLFLEHRFAASPAPGTRQQLLFEAVNRTATVWLNGQEIGRHSGGFTLFSREVTGKLAASNRLVVRVDSRHDAASLPSVDFD
jgi:beta-glucuronidase